MQIIKQENNAKRGQGQEKRLNTVISNINLLI